MSLPIQKLLLILSMLAMNGCTAIPDDKGAPLIYLTNYNQQQTVKAKHGGVASIHPLASKVGLYILQKGGNAIDAAIAMQLALAVVYPSAGNIGGGGFMTMRLADGTIRFLDFRETAPYSASKNMYLEADGKVNAEKSITGHLAPGVPGTIAGIFESLPFAKFSIQELIQPAIDLAERGYVITSGIANDVPKSDGVVNTTSNVYDISHQWKEGDTLKQVDLANTLKRIRDEGRKDFYEGKTAELIVAEMKRGGGLMTMDDLKAYRAKWRNPIVFNYRGYQIISAPLPSSGGILLNQMLKMIEPFPLGAYGFGSVRAMNLMIEAERRAYKCRAQYLGDCDYYPVPVNKLTSNEFIRKQMSDFTPLKAGVSTALAHAIPAESKETTHFSVVDNYGNAVSVTTTLNGPYGSGVIVGGAGFFLNNEMNDFALKPGNISFSGGVGGVPNVIEPGKRMLSSMSPTIVLKDNQFFMVLGTPGGTTIPTSVFQALVNVIDFGMSGTEAVLAPKFHHEWLPDEVAMSGRFSPDTVMVLKKIGYRIKPGGFSSLELIKVDTYALSMQFEIVSQDGSAEGY